MSLIKDFVTYCSCYEISQEHAIWSAIGLLAATVNRKCHYMIGDVELNCTMFTCLVSEQGTGKSTAKDFARDAFTAEFQDISLMPSVTSKEDIVKFMASEDCQRYYKGLDGQPVPYKPYMGFVNELKSFCNFNPSGMFNMLTDISDRKVFDSGTIKRGLENIINPALSFLCCETPEWIINNLKADVLTGGFCRRMNFVYSVYTGQVVDPKPRPVITTEAREAMNRVRRQLRVTNELVGEFKWNSEGARLHDKWYCDNKRNLPDDPIMRGWKRTCGAQLVRICMLLAASRPEPQLILTPELLEEGLALLTIIEYNMPKLFMASGRNELAGPQQKILDILESRDGWIPEKLLIPMLDKDLTPSEQQSVLYHLRNSDRIFKETVRFPPTDTNPNGTTRVMFMTRAKYVEWKNDGSLTKEEKPK